jgi:hypothetical protein
VHRLAHHRIRSRCHWKLEDGYLVEGSNVGIHGGAGGDKGADSLWIPGLTAVEVDRSVKVRRDKPKEKSADFGKHRPFFVPLERIWYCTTRYYSPASGRRVISGKRNFSVAVRHTQPHAQQPEPYEVIMKDKCAVT